MSQNCETCVSNLLKVSGYYTYAHPDSCCTRPTERDAAAHLSALSLANAAESTRAAVKLPEQAARALARPGAGGFWSHFAVIMATPQRSTGYRRVGGGSGETGVHLAKHRVRAVPGGRNTACPGSVARPRLTMET